MYVLDDGEFMANLPEKCKKRSRNADWRAARRPIDSSLSLFLAFP
jgi:hypothetical protein